MNGGQTRLQNAMEFMLTYGWAILIILIVIATLYSLGIFSQGSVTPNICTLPANIGCQVVSFSPNGVASISLQQATQYTINVIGIGCNSQDSATTNTPPGGAQLISVGGNYTFTGIQCYTVTGTTWTAFNAPIGQTYTGYLIVNYTDVSTGFQHTASGSLVQKVT